MWSEEDGFFYDVLRTPDGRSQQLKVRSMIGLLPLCAAAVVNEQVVAALPELQQRARWLANHRPHLVSEIHDPRRPGYRDRRLLSLLSEERLRRVLGHLLDEEEFLSPFGIRSLSRYHLAHPYQLDLGGQELRFEYLPAESQSGMFGGNSNWGGPIWMPVNGLLVRALINYYGYYGPSFRVECPTGSGRLSTLYEVAKELTERLARIFLLDESGKRPVFGQAPKFSDDPALARSPALLRVLPRGQRRRDRRQPSDGMDRPRRLAAPLLRDRLAGRRAQPLVSGGGARRRRRPPRARAARAPAASADTE